MWTRWRMVDESMLGRMGGLTEPGSRTVVDHAFALSGRPRRGFRVRIPLVCRSSLLGVYILRDLPKRPDGSVGWEGRSRKLCMRLSRTCRKARMLVYLEGKMSC